MRAFVSLRFSWLSQERFEAVPIGRQAGNPDDVVDAPRSAAAGDVDDDVHRLRDQRSWHGDRSFEDQLFEPDQGAFRRAGVDGGDATRMPGSPRLEQIERLAAADFANDDTIRSQPQ